MDVIRENLRDEGGGNFATHDAGVVDEVVDALLPHNLRRFPRRVLD